jgi:hypothetical protein
MPKTISSNDNVALGPIGCRSRLGGVLNYYYRGGVKICDKFADTTGAAVPAAAGASRADPTSTLPVARLTARRCRSDS